MSNFKKEDWVKNSETGLVGQVTEVDGSVLEVSWNNGTFDFVEVDEVESFSRHSVSFFSDQGSNLVRVN
jgi:preprotein translocase subunit YajC